jgi:hypothetical protein
MQREGGNIRCRGNCPVHTACPGAICPRSDVELSAAEPIDGHVPLAQCDTCAALFGFEHAALRYLEHPVEWRQSGRSGRPPGIP